MSAETDKPYARCTTCTDLTFPDRDTARKHGEETMQAYSKLPDGVRPIIKRYAVAFQSIQAATRDVWGAIRGDHGPHAQCLAQCSDILVRGLVDAEDILDDALDDVRREQSAIFDGLHARIVGGAQ